MSVQPAYYSWTIIVQHKKGLGIFCLFLYRRFIPRSHHDSDGHLSRPLRRMQKDQHLRRSRSWRDLSSFMSRRRLAGDNPPPVPIKRASSLGPARLEARKSRLFHNDANHTVINTTANVQDERGKERAFQRRESVKRKPVKKNPSEGSAPVGPSPAFRRESHLPGFAFSSQALEPPPPRTHKRSSSFKEFAAAMHSRSYSASTAGHSRMASEMSVPMIADFDLSKHQDSRYFLSDPPLNFDFETPKSPERELSAEEKAEIINNASPMHVIDIHRIGSKSPTRGGTLKRLFSRGKSKKSFSPRLPSTPKSSPPTKAASPVKSVPIFEAANATTIYQRPPLVKAPLSPPPSPHRKDAPPRLTVQIPDSTMGRASKIFESIYVAHAHAQESIGNQWEFPTPPTTSAGPSSAPPRSVDILDAAMEFTRRISGHRNAPKPKNHREHNEAHQSSMSAPSTPQRRRSIRVMSILKRNSRMVHTSSGDLVVFPRPPGMESVVQLSDVEESENSGEEDDDEESDDGWDDSSFSAKLGSPYKEPEWEMLTPPNKGGKN